MRRSSALLLGLPAIALGLMVVQCGRSGWNPYDRDEVVTGLQPAGSYRFRPLRVEPDPSGWGYRGEFEFVHHGPGPVQVYATSAPRHRHVKPVTQWVGVREGDRWREWNVGGGCGHGRGHYTLRAGQPYVFEVDLSELREPLGRLTGRVTVSGFRSEPFVIDWPADRRNQRFERAWDVHCERIASVFVHAGFASRGRRGLAFCRALVASLLATERVEIDLGRATAHGEVWVRPISLGEIVELRFRCGSVRGVLVLDPSRFDRATFRAALRERIEIRRHPGGLHVEVGGPGTPDGPELGLALELDYWPPGLPGRTTAPGEAEARAVVEEMLETLAAWLAR